MKKKIIFPLLLTMSFINSSENLHARLDSRSIENDKEKLAQILKKSAEYCERLANVTLNFVCREKITEIINQYQLLYGDPQGKYAIIYAIIPPIISDKEINTFTYDYQLIKKGDLIKERRILLEENGEKKYEENAPLKTKRFFTKRPVCAPIGLLSKYWQNFYNYKIIEEENLDGKETVVIEARPKSLIKEKPNYGKIWVDKEDFSILKIEFFQESLYKFRELKKMARRYLLKPRLTDTHYFEIEKNGIRFPSKVHFKEAYLTKQRKRIILSETTFVYDNYKFFTVEVEIDYKGKKMSSKS